MPRLPRPAFCLVTPGSARSAEEQIGLVRLVVRAAGAGVNVVQVREPQLPDRALYNLIRRILAEIDRSQALILVNERADVALAAGADGVHLRGDSAAASRVRPIVPDGFVIGRSVHSVYEALAAEREGSIDYLIFGTVFPSANKPSHHAVAGIGQLRAVCNSVHLPVIAIGGITLARLGEVAAAGAAGFAAIGMFVDANPAGIEAMNDVLKGAQRMFDTQSRACLE